MNRAQALLIVCFALTSPQLAAQTEKWFPDETTPWSHFPGSISGESVYLAGLRALGERPIEKESDHNSARFLIQMSFQTTLAVTIMEGKWLDQTETGYEWPSDYSLTVSYTDANNEVQTFPGGNHRSRTVEHYYVKLSEEDFATTIDALFEAELFHAPAFAPAKRLCADGTGYSIEAKYEGHYNFVDRYYCFGRFHEDFPKAQILIALARKKLPMLTARFDAIERNVSSFQGE